ncbi:STAS domain-containing protein [Streptomyces ficellus]|uniref:Anti-sigma factor antagonist n=1 Tax=Streptomyces ficellus TaxID=1977088 RepID=A0A6I6FR94_9ACTN|nr:STAS domain-containing protein [Streptomyces ficellus]QGV82059.1 anti-sigma factor antagonist [Streptomyces ficellus]
MDTHVQALPDERGTRIILCSGEFDTASAPQLRSALEAARADRVRRTVVDLSLVTFADSAFISVLLHAHHRQRLVLALPPPSPVRRILSLLGLDGVLHLAPDLGTAAAPDP